MIPCLTFKAITHAYLLSMSIIYDKNLNPLLNLLINVISARFAMQILSIKGECIFLFPNFLIIGLYNFSPNSLLDIISFLTVLLEHFLIKKCLNH